MKQEFKRELIGSLVFAGFMVVLSVGSHFAFKQGYIEGETVTRLLTGAMGLWMIWYGNRLPKTMLPVPAYAGRARRVSSWSLVLSGFVYVGLWAFAPIPVAMWGGIGTVLTGAAVTFGYCLSIRNKGKAA